MAANPVQFLRHGKALCGKVFRTFVETFNWLVMFSQNLKGDRDCDPAATGKITVDRTDPDHPVIRCTGCGDGSVDVVTDVSISYDTSTNSIVLTCAKKTITVLGEASASPATSSLTFAEQDVVTNTSYSTSTHEFTQTKATINVPSAGQGTDVEVFTATPHSAEH